MKKLKRGRGGAEEGEGGWGGGGGGGGRVGKPGICSKIFGPGIHTGSIPDPDAHIVCRHILALH